MNYRALSNSRRRSRSVPSYVVVCSPQKRARWFSPLLVCLVGAVAAAPLSDAATLMQKSDCAAAVQLSGSLAAKDDPLAQFRLRLPKSVTGNRSVLARETTRVQVTAQKGTVGRLPLETKIAAHEPEKHFGELADPSVWPISAVGAVTVAALNRIKRCTGTLVAPKLVLTAAHCLFVGTQLINPGNVRFLAGLNRGVPAAHSVGKRLVI